MTPALSVLDLVPVRTDQTSGDAVQSSLALARLADELGYTRYWLAEHHNMPAVAATNPPVLIGLVASVTRRIRVGSGGVMLPNHTPMVVAEQFALLEAAFPGRIDLGIGRAPGTDPVTRYVLRDGATDGAEVDRFPEHVDNVLAMMDTAGVSVAIGGRRHELHATPAAASVPTIWLLGSSDYSARLAAQKGMPYVFAHHFAGSAADTRAAIELYRSSFRPSPELAEPRTFLTLNASVADTLEEAERQALPQLLSMLRLRTGAPLRPQQLVEEAEKEEVPEAHRGLLDAMRRRWVIDAPAEARTRIAALAGEYGVDEVMVSPVGGAHVGDPVDRAPGREQTLRLLAEVD